MNKKPLIIFGAIIGTLLITIPLLLSFTTKKEIKNKQESVPSKTYTNPKKTYSIQVPSNWKTQQTTATQITQGKSTGNTEIVNFVSETGIGITIQTYTGTIPCESIEKSNTKVAGIPTVFNKQQQMYTINTKSATYIITYAYPGARIHNVQSAVDNSSSQTNQTQDQQTIDTIVSSFLPQNLEPLKCN